MRVRSMQRALRRWATAAGAALLAGFASADTADEAGGSPLSRSRATLFRAGLAPSLDGRDRPPEGARACTWVTGPPCSLGPERQASCVMIAPCPTGMKVVSGGCEGFTSVAIGRSAPSEDLAGWSCAAARLFPIRETSEISARALCCP